ERAHLFLSNHDSKAHSISSDTPPVTRLRAGWFLIAKHRTAVLRCKRSRHIKMPVGIEHYRVCDLAVRAIELNLCAFPGNFKKHMISAPRAGRHSPGGCHSRDNGSSQQSATHHDQQIFHEHLEIV